MQYAATYCIMLYICITNLVIITKITMEKGHKKRILNFITYYRLLPLKCKGALRIAIENKCQFSGGTFYYRLRIMKFTHIEVAAIESVISKHKKNETI